MMRANIESLLHRLADGDKEGVLIALRQAAANEFRAGRKTWAATLEGFASRLERRATFEPKMLTLLNPSGKNLASLAAFRERVPTRRIGDLIAHPALAAEIEGFLKEQMAREELGAFGLEPQNKLLFVGPPGSGKTLLAEILAAETEKPFYILQMGQLMDSLLGNTIRNIENSFLAIAQCDGVFLLDEFDALSTARNHQQDVNEMRRALNALLQCFEGHLGKSIVIAATNHPQSIDPAFRRRFDAIWEFKEPTRKERETLIVATLKKHQFSQEAVTKTRLLEITAGMSFDESEDTVKKAIKAAVIEKTTGIPEKTLESLRHQNETRRQNHGQDKS